ncbi:RHS repeat-associated core domain-containing protein [Acinetobacter sp. A-IN1]|uniref:RHS repeat-associated core domain-containing protein n=2 Tax=Acinetobacter nematophilus TaxID=2994642 RepID=A0A9X3DST0_9GAMM|nr:RHS repeat-associated core domain-containing protein [Acinetobacter nematophilus]MCX5467172.1 RHS repeat-associated core domain-containing protein [Acinetobacter nematophilus]
MKNKNMQSNKVWSSAVQLMLLSFVLLLSQLTLAKDRIQYHVQNFDGSTLKVINEQGVVSQSYQYAPFGQQLQYKKPSNLKNPNAFVGGVQDADDLVYLKQRHYNPVLGRFYQPDPVTFLEKGHGQTNRYQYGWNDSYTFRDPQGTSVEKEPNVWMPWVFGTIVHNVFAYQLDSSASNWEGGVSWSAWGLGFKPDGVERSFFDSAGMNLVELKPISYLYDKSLYNGALEQLRTYKLVAGINFTGQVNTSGVLPNTVQNFKMPYLDGYWYTIRYDTTSAPINGLIFYTKERGDKLTPDERLKYSSAAAITLGAIGLLNYASRGKIPSGRMPPFLPAY